MPIDLLGLSISQISQRLQTKALDPVELTEFFLDRIEAHIDQSVFTTVLRKQALVAAEQSWQRWKDSRSLGLFDGIPIAWKDLIDIKGVPTSAGSKLYMRDGPVNKDALIVNRLHESGAVALGKTNLSEFAFSGVGLNPHFGTPVIAHDYENDNATLPAISKRHVPGGSSCGAAVAVSCGLAPISIGTDTSGSVRVPASLNGLVGHHSSPGRYPTDGVFCLSSTLDTIGTLAKTVEDCLLMDCALRGENIVSEQPLDLATLKLIIPENYICEDCERDVIENFEVTIELLASCGVKIKRCIIDEISFYSQTMAQHGALVTAEAYYGRQKDLTPERQKLVDPLLVTRLKLGEKMSAVDFIAILEARKKLHKGLMAHLSAGYILAMPTVPLTAPRLKPLLDDADLFAKTNLTLIRNTMIASIAGLCSLTLPSGLDKNGLSIGILFCGQPGTDRHLMQYGIALSAAQRPAI